MEPIMKATRRKFLSGSLWTLILSCLGIKSSRAKILPEPAQEPLAKTITAGAPGSEYVQVLDLDRNVPLTLVYAVNEKEGWIDRYKVKWGGHTKGCPRYSLVDDGKGSCEREIVRGRFKALDLRTSGIEQRPTVALDFVPRGKRGEYLSPDRIPSLLELFCDKGRPHLKYKDFSDTTICV